MRIDVYVFLISVCRIASSSSSTSAFSSSAHMAGWEGNGEWRQHRTRRRRKQNLDIEARVGEDENA